MSAWLISQAWPYALGLVALLWAYASGRHSGKVKAHRDTLESYEKTRKAADNADTGIGASDAERIDRLRKCADKS